MATIGRQPGSCHGTDPFKSGDFRMTIVSGPGVKSLNILDPGDAGVIEMVLRVPRIAVEAVHTSRSGEESPLYAAGHRTD